MNKTLNTLLILFFVLFLIPLYIAYPKIAFLTFLMVFGMVMVVGSILKDFR